MRASKRDACGYEGQRISLVTINPGKGGKRTFLPFSFLFRRAPLNTEPMIIVRDGKRGIPGGKGDEKMSGFTEHQSSGASDLGRRTDTIMTWTQAQSMLPLVRRIVADIVSHVERLIA